MLWRGHCVALAFEALLAAEGARRGSSHLTRRWRKPDSNLYGAFPVKWLFSVYSQFFVNGAETAVMIAIGTPRHLGQPMVDSFPPTCAVLGALANDRKGAGDSARVAAAGKHKPNLKQRVWEEIPRRRLPQIP